jgi:hypothetical protein
MGCFPPCSAEGSHVSETLYTDGYGHLESFDAKFEHVTNPKTIHNKKRSRIWLSSSRCETHTFGPYKRVQLQEIVQDQVARFLPPLPSALCFILIVVRQYSSISMMPQKESYVW